MQPADERRNGSMYTLDRMAGTARRVNPWIMRSPPTPSPSRVPYDDIYDPACDLVEATARLRRAAAAPENAHLSPALLGCMEAALQDLLWTAAALEQTSVRMITEHSRGRADPRSRLLVERMQRGWANLQETLIDAERAAAAARPLVARGLAATSAESRRRRLKTER